MKNVLLFVVVAFLVVACQNDESAVQSELLYRRWQQTRTMRIGDNNGWVMYNMDAAYDTEYRPDGTFVYRRNGEVVSPGCCAPTRFTQEGRTFTYTDWNICPNVRCALVKQATITQLMNELLELSDGTNVTQYAPVK